MPRSASSFNTSTAAQIAALYAPSNGNRERLFIAYDTANVGKVYAVMAKVAGGAILVTLVGTIDLGATGWDTLTVANFV